MPPVALATRAAGWRVEKAALAWGLPDKRAECTRAECKRAGRLHGD